MSRTAIFVGQINQRFYHYLKSQNYLVGLFIDKSDFKNEDTDTLDEIKQKYELDFIFPLNISSPKVLAEDLKGVYFKPNTLLVVIQDRHLLPAAHIASILNLDQSKNLTLDIAKKGTNKILQRKAFAELHAEISPAFKRIHNFHGAYTFIRKYGFPVIVKPASLAGSRLVEKCNDLEELIKKVSYVLDHVGQAYKDNKVYRKPQVIIETFIEGRLYSIDSYVDEKGQVVHTSPCREMTGAELGLETFELPFSYYSDTDYSAQEEKIMFNTVEKAIESLNLRSLPVHTEVKISDEGKCQVIEMNIRSGGHRSELLDASYGIDHPKNIIHTLLNNPIEVPSKLKKYSLFLKLWAPEVGLFKKIQNLDQVQKLPSFVTYNSTTDVGQEVGPSSKGFTKIIHFILAHKSFEQVTKDMETIMSTVTFELDPIES